MAQLGSCRAFFHCVRRLISIRLPGAALVLALAAAPVLANTYYVSPTGNNNNNGSSGSPWQTLAKAAGAVAPGDTVNVLSGNYAGFTMDTSGTAANRITFSAQSGAVINVPNSVGDGITVNGSYVTVQGFSLIGTGDVNTSHAGISVLGDGFTNPNAFNIGCIIQNNTADQWGKWGIFSGFAQNLTVQNNITEHTSQQHGIYISNSADNPIIRGNISHDNAGSGIQINADYNTGTRSLPGVDGIITNALVEQNIIYNNGTAGGAALNNDGVQNSIFRNNLLYNNHAGGITLYDEDGADGSKNNVVENNTLINATNGRYTVSITDGSTGNTLFNNIIYDLNTSSARGALEVDSTSTSGFKSNGNILDPRLSWSDGANLNLTNWRSTTGDDLSSISVTLAQLQALFTNYGANNFTLAAGSSALDTGLNGLLNGSFFAAPTTDLLGNGRPVGSGFDVGAYERLPEPGTLALLGLAALAGLARRKR